MVSKKKPLNSSGDILLAKRDIRCWYCQLHGNDILDKFGCCKRCETNLIKYPHRGKLIYPGLNDEKLAQEVLGTREKCVIPSEGGASTQLPIFEREYEKNAGKVNHCKICWQKTLFFVWSTSRAIDKDRLKDIDSFKSVANLERLGYPVCCACVKKEAL